AAVADVVDVRQGLVALGAVVEAEVDHHPLPDPVPAHAAADGDDAADDVRALDAREAEGGAAAPPSGDLRGIGLAAVGALAHPDVGVVHAAGVDVDEHLPRCRVGGARLTGVHELVQAAMAHQSHGLHGAGDRRHRSPPVAECASTLSRTYHQ